MTDGSPQARAWRLKRLRDCTGLSRSEFEARHNISANTIRGWETVCHGGLTENGAKLFIDAIKSEGVLCDLQWLLYGGDNTPYVSPNAFNQDVSNKVISEDLLIQGEISALKTFYKNIILFNVIDEVMSPTFSVGDLVIGLPALLENKDVYSGRPCIIVCDGGAKVLRIPRINEISGEIQLLSLSPNIQANRSDLNIITIAPIIWHRRMS